MNTQLLTNTLGPIELWSFSTTAEDARVRDELYRRLGPANARKLLGAQYPGGSISSEVDTSSILLSIDGIQYSNIGSRYDPGINKLSFIPQDPLGDGEHEIILSVQSTIGTFSADTTNFTIQSGVVQFLTLFSEIIL